MCPNSNIKNNMNIVFESYKDNLVTGEDEIDNWIKTI